MIRDIAGRQNHSVKLARKLQKKKYRRERGLWSAKGWTCSWPRWRAAPTSANPGPPRTACRAAGRPARAGRASEAGAAPTRRPAGVDIGICDQETLDYASSLGGSADVIFICVAAGVAAWPTSTWAASWSSSSTGVGDPGNVGTLVRSAVAFGLGGVICSPGTADPYGPKALARRHGSAVLAAGGRPRWSPADLEARLAALAGAGQSRPAGAGRRSHGGRRRPRGGARRRRRGRWCWAASGADRSRVGTGASGSPSRSAASTR